MKYLVTGLKWFALAVVAVVAYDSILPPISTLMVARWVTLQSAHREWVSLEHISPAMRRAAIAAEDGKFCSHHGVDWQALHSAVEKAVDDEDSAHGASTITMQVVKNLFLWPGRSYVRKGIEIPAALMIDAIWGKRRVMEVYLNVAEFGEGVFGVEAAAWHYFGKPAAALDSREAALLAATLPNPTHRNPARPSVFVSAYASVITARVQMNGVATGCLKDKEDGF